jgi:hypothetical protein
VLQCTAGGAVEAHVAHSDPNYEGYVGASVPSLEGMTRAPDGALLHALHDAPGSAWSCHLDGPDSFVGVFTMCIRPPRRPVEEKIVIVVGNVGPGQKLQEEMFALAEERAGAGATFEQFAASPQYRYARKVAERNRDRLGAQYAQLLGVSVLCTADALSAEHQAREQALAEVAATLPRAPSDQPRECRFGLQEYQQLAEDMEERSEGNVDVAAALLHEELVERGVDAEGVDLLSLAQHLAIDPGGAVGANPYLQRSVDEDAADGADGAAAVPRLAAPISATANSCIEVSGRSAIVYRNAVPQDQIAQGHGVVMTLSRAEGVAVMHGNDCAEKNRSPFGNADPDAAYSNATPTCTGRALQGAQVDWSAAAQVDAAQAAPFLRWRSARLPSAAALHPDSSLDSAVPHQDAIVGDRCVRRERGLGFMEAVKAQSTTKLAAQHFTMLDPLAVVLPPQAIRDFPGRSIPSGR